MIGPNGQKQKDFQQKYQDVNRKMQEDEASKQAAGIGLPYIDLHKFPVDLNALSLITEEQARDAEMVPFYKDGYDLRIGTINPANKLLKQHLAEFAKIKLQPKVYIISRASFTQTLDMYLHTVKHNILANDQLKISPDQHYIGQLPKLAESEKQIMTASEILEILLGAAYQYRASDIHIEPEGNFLKIRFRLDGVLSDVVHMAKSYQKPLASRIKLIAKLKMNIENIAQDGRFSYTLDNNAVDVRVADLPGAYGETFVLRLLGNDAIQLKFEDLGLSGKAYDAIKSELDKPNGMILTTGPTGSGKTTTLYTFLSQLNNPGVKIITLEDPIEYKLEGVNQTPVNGASGMNFVSGLRAILRQDPDVVMIGEIRDTETAETAMQASLTGHMVLSTLHTNDASGAIPRLINMGVKAFVMAPALNAIIGQRLVRKLCTDCRKERQMDKAMLERVMQIIKTIPANSGVVLPKEPKFYSAPGCKMCNNVGYRGRIGIFEVIAKNPELEQMILDNAGSLAIKMFAQKQGMLTMVQDGILKAMAGVTDVEEVFRVT